MCGHGCRCFRCISFFTLPVLWHTPFYRWGDGDRLRDVQTQVRRGGAIWAQLCHLANLVLSHPLCISTQLSLQGPPLMPTRPQPARVGEGEDQPERAGDGGRDCSTHSVPNTDAFTKPWRQLLVHVWGISPKQKFSTWNFWIYQSSSFLLKRDTPLPKKFFWRTAFKLAIDLVHKLYLNQVVKKEIGHW